MNLEAGTRIYNHGDMANPDHFGTVSAVKKDAWGTHIQITPDTDRPCAHDAPYWVPACAFSEKYLGHGGTRFVTEAAYKAYRAEQMAAFRARKVGGVA